NRGWRITNRSKISLTRTATGGQDTIRKSFSLSYTRGATAANDSATATNAINSAISAWTQAARPWRVEIKQPGCGTHKLNMISQRPIVAVGADVSVSVDKRVEPGLRRYVSGGTAMTYYLNGVGHLNWTMIHEIGHTFGLPDEYTYNRPTATPAP